MKIKRDSIYYKIIIKGFWMKVQTVKNEPEASDHNIEMWKEINNRISNYFSFPKNGSEEPTEDNRVLLSLGYDIENAIQEFENKTMKDSDCICVFKQG